MNARLKKAAILASIPRNLDWKLKTGLIALKRLGETHTLAKRHMRRLEQKVADRDETIRQLRKENELLRENRSIPPQVELPCYTFKKIELSPWQILGLDVTEILPIMDSLSSSERALMNRILNRLDRLELSQRTVAHSLVYGLTHVKGKSDAFLREALKHYKLSYREARQYVGLT